MTQVKPVTSRDNPLLIRLRKLACDPGAYRKLGEVWIEGDHLCSALLKRGGSASHAIVTELAWEQARYRDIASHAGSVIVVPQALMDGLSALESPSPIGFVVPWKGPGTLVADAPTIVLDRLQDAGNVGTILRSASAFGFTQIVAIKGTAALWSPKVLRAGMGAHFGLQLIEGVESARELDVPMLAASSHADEAIHQSHLPWPCAWVMGHEGQGVSEALMKQCAKTLRIPQPGGEESLNVSVAAAICMYESSRRRL